MRIPSPPCLLKHTNHESVISITSLIFVNIITLLTMWTTFVPHSACEPQSKYHCWPHVAIGTHIKLYYFNGISFTSVNSLYTRSLLIIYTACGLHAAWWPHIKFHQFIGISITSPNYVYTGAFLTICTTCGQQAMSAAWIVSSTVIMVSQSHL